MDKLAIIKKLPNGKYRLYSKKKDKNGKRRNLGTFDSISAAKDREKDINYFKHNADDGETDSELDKLISDLSTIAAYLEEAGMSGANEISKAMDAIDGSFADDGIPEWEMELANMDISPKARKKEKLYRKHEILTDPEEMDEMTGENPDLYDLMSYNKINKELDEIYRTESAGGYAKAQRWIEENVDQMKLSDNMKQSLLDRVSSPMWEIFDANDGDYADDPIMASVPDVQMNYPGSGNYEMTGEVAGGTQALFSIPEATVMAHLVEKLTKLANHLDGIGYFDCASEIDEITKSLRKTK